MRLNLRTEYNLRGYAFQHIIRMVLRRQNKNNFIFCINQHDGLDEFRTKCKLKIEKNLLDIEWGKGDLIVFIVNNVEERIVKEIILYEVKTRNANRLIQYLEICRSDNAFYKKCVLKGIRVKVVETKIYRDWIFDMYIDDYYKFSIQVYSRY